MMRNINDAFNTLIKPNKANILAACKELGITSFQVEYQGCGDSGSVSEISCEPKEHLALLETHHCEQMRPKYCAENKEVISQQVFMPLKEAMDDLTCCSCVGSGKVANHSFSVCLSWLLLFSLPIFPLPKPFFKSRCAYLYPLLIIQLSLAF